VEAKRVSKLIGFGRANFKREAGQAIVEYGLVLGLVSIAAMVGLTAMGGGVGGLYDTMQTIVNAMVDAMARA
jgi:Flp pilus assembly pilin Flp